MSLSHGRDYLAIPGPSVMPDRVLQAMHRPSPNIYEGEIVALTARVLDDLRAVACTTAKCAIYICNGHGAWEAALANTVGPGDHVLVIETGRFAEGWGNIAKSLGAIVERMRFGYNECADPQRVADRLVEDVARKIKAVLIVQTDTASSVRNDIETLGKAIRATSHPALFMVDCIASLACDVYRMDDWLVDVTVAGSQKGLMTPPGLGIVWFNERADQVRASMERVSTYWDWDARIDPEIFYLHFCGTPPTHHLFGLGEALDMILREEGLQGVWDRHHTHARAVWAAVQAWGGEIACNIPAPANRSTAVTGVRTGSGDATRLRQWCEAHAGLTLGISLGLLGKGAPDVDSMFRLGHMGHVNPPMILGALATIEAGLTALSIPHDGGAVDAAARIIAAS